MPRDPIGVLRTVRRLAIQQARHAVATCLAAETAAADRLQAIDDAARRDRAANQALVEAHRFADIFALRLQADATDRREAEAALTAARCAAAEARVALVAARTAAEAVETLIAERTEMADADARRREQHDLDDMARSRFDSPFR